MRTTTNLEVDKPWGSLQGFGAKCNSINCNTINLSHPGKSCFYVDGKLETEIDPTNRDGVLYTKFVHRKASRSSCSWVDSITRI